MVRSVLLSCFLALVLVYVSAFQDSGESIEEDPYQEISREEVGSAVFVGYGDERIPNDINLGLRKYLGARNLTEGHKKEGDSLLYKLTVYDVPRPQYTRHTVLFHTPRRESISYIEAFDLNENQSNAGVAHIRKGGVGHRRAHIILKSAPGQSLNFTVQIWGKLHDSNA
ncbi:hypothetical protein M8J77_007862 [Diaphorina citri]|nr:hypothetical protein M8J77_007862 [Diaphorina citri]